MKNLKAKPVSLVAQIIAAVWIAAWSAYKFIVCPSTITIDDIAMSGFFIVLCFSPVAISIILDKIKLIRFGDLETQIDTEEKQIGFQPEEESNETN